MIKYFKKRRAQKLRCAFDVHDWKTYTPRTAYIGGMRPATYCKCCKCGAEDLVAISKSQLQGMPSGTWDHG